MKNILGNNQLLLASKSPRRSSILESAGIPFSIISCDWDENYSNSMKVEDVPQYLSYHKALHVKKQLKENQILLTADTVVIKDRNLLGKPKDKDNAVKILKNLSDNTHHVITGTTFMDQCKIVNTSCLSEVKFMSLTDDEIEQYIEECAPFDKAGSYGIQDWLGLCKINSIKGSYHNIMGLPIHLVYSVLRAW